MNNCRIWLLGIVDFGREATIEFSPAFQGWVSAEHNILRRVVTVDDVQSSHRDETILVGLAPGVETPG